MARPIAIPGPLRDPRKELAEKLEEAPAEHAEALLDAYELLEQLHDRQVFALLRGMLAAGGKLSDAAAGAVDSPQPIAALRNLIVIAKAFGSIDPEVMRGIAGAASETMCASERMAKPPSFLKLLAELRQEDRRRGVAFINDFLGALGRRLRKQPPRNKS